MTGTDTASTEATAPVEATPPAEETNEEAFAAAFDEFAAVDDTEAATPPAEGREDGDQASAGAPAEKTEEAPASGEQSPDNDDASTDDAAEPPDIWADASPEQRAAFEAAQHENASNRTRASAQNRKIAALMAAPKPAAEPAADRAATPETDEGWEQFKSDYPEVAAPMEKRFESRMAKLEAENTDLRGQVTGIADARQQDAIDSEEALLVQRHPDWEQLSVSEAFNEWLPQQPRYVQEGFARNGTAIVDGQEAASLIDLFKGDSAPPGPSSEGSKPPEATATNGKATRRQRRLESAVQTESGQAGPGAGPPEGDFDAAFDHFAAQP